MPDEYESGGRTSYPKDGPAEKDRQDKRDARPAEETDKVQYRYYDWALI